MIDGNYQLMVKTPIGNKMIKVFLKQEGERLLGTLEMMGIKANLENGKIHNNHFLFQGNLNSIIGVIQYEITGNVKGDLRSSSSYQ